MEITYRAWGLNIKRNLGQIHRAPGEDYTGGVKMAKNNIKSVIASESLLSGQNVIIFYDEQDEDFRARLMTDKDKYISGWATEDAEVGEPAQILVWNTLVRIE